MAIEGAGLCVYAGPLRGRGFVGGRGHHGGGALWVGGVIKGVVLWVGGAVEWAWFCGWAGPFGAGF